MSKNQVVNLWLLTLATMGLLLCGARAQERWVSGVVVYQSWRVTFEGNKDIYITDLTIHTDQANLLRVSAWNSNRSDRRVHEGAELAYDSSLLGQSVTMALDTAEDGAHRIRRIRLRGGQARRLDQWSVGDQRQWRVDLDGDGALEAVMMQCLEAPGQGRDKLLRDELVLYRDPASPLARTFLQSRNPWGYDLQVVDDINADGVTDLVFGLRARLTTPPFFLWATWKDGRLRLVTEGSGSDPYGSAGPRESAKVLIERPSGKGRYHWKAGAAVADFYRYDAGKERWIQRFVKRDPAGYLVEIVETDYKQKIAKLGRAVVAADDTGFHIVRWIAPPSLANWRQPE